MESVDALVDLLPPGIRVVRDPEATQLADALDIRSTPFAVALNEGRVAGKSYLYGKADLTTVAETVQQRDLTQVKLSTRSQGGDP
jgi:hypothetical protein